ncbi:winged helix-turn-helix transcriptional regulator [Streptosporangium lutulentum]
MTTAPQVPVPCPIGRAVGLLGERWTLLILRNANLGTTRFDAFRAELGVADNILSNRLARLVEAGLLARVPYRDGGAPGRSTGSRPRGPRYCRCCTLWPSGARSTPSWPSRPARCR